MMMASTIRTMCAPNLDPMPLGFLKHMVLKCPVSHKQESSFLCIPVTVKSFTHLPNPRMTRNIMQLIQMMTARCQLEHLIQMMIMT